MEIVLSLAWFAFFVFLIKKLTFFRAEGISTALLQFLFTVKVAAGVLLWAVYTYYYTDRSTADIFKYFDDSKIIFDALPLHPADYLRMLTGIGDDNIHIKTTYYHHMNFWYTTYWENQTIIRFNAFVRIFSMEYYHIHSIMVCFISFCGLVFLYKSFYPYMKEKKRLLVFSLFLFPSVIFWSSGVLKEGFILFGLGLLLYYFLNGMNTSFTARHLAMIVSAIIILSLTKAYILIAIMPGLIAFWWINKKNIRQISRSYGIVFIGGACIFLNLHHVHPEINVTQTLWQKQRDFINLGQGGAWVQKDTTIYAYIPPERTKQWFTRCEDSNYVKLKKGISFYYFRIPNMRDTIYENNFSDTATCYEIITNHPASGSFFHLPRIKRDNTWSVFSNMPVAVWNVMMRPYPKQIRSPFLLIALIENMFILLLIVCCIFFYQKPGKEVRNVVWFCVGFALTVFILTGLTTPVAGAIMRYKVPVMPFLLTGLWLLIDTQKFRARFPFMKRWL